MELNVIGNIPGIHYSKDYQNNRMEAPTSLVQDMEAMQLHLFCQFSKLYAEVYMSTFALQAHLRFKDIKQNVHNHLVIT